MNELRERRAFERDHFTAFGWFSILAGVLSALLVLANLAPMPQNVAELLPFFTNHFELVARTATVVLCWAVLSVPFVVALGQVLRARSAGLAQAATLLSTVGIVLLGFANFMAIGAVLSIAAAGDPLSGGDASYQATIWRNLSFYLTEPGLMTWGLGQFLFGWLAWKGELLPNWVAMAGMVGGAAGLLTLAAIQTPVLALVQLLCFAVWGFATGIILLQRRER